MLGLVLVPLSVLAIWTNNQVSDTERFVATVSPIVEDPSVQTALADRITAEVLARVDIRQIVDEIADLTGPSRKVLAGSSRTRSRRRWRARRSSRPRNDPPRSCTSS